MMRRTLLPLALVLSVGGCKAPADDVAAPAADGSAAAATEASPAAAPVSDAQRDAWERSFGVRDPDAQLFVTAAVDAARLAAGRRALARIEASSVDRVVEPDLHVTFVFASNIHAELDDCGCRSHPLGGLDRLATLMNHVDELTEHPVVRLDTGNALARFDARVSASTEEVLAAESVLRAFDIMGIRAMTLGTHDLSLGDDVLATILGGPSVEVVSANVIAPRLDVADHAVFDAEGLRIGTVGLTGGRDPGPDWVGAELGWGDDLTSVARGVRAARDEGADIVVLLSSAGMTDTATALRTLGELEALPDLAFVSGSGAKSAEPLYEAGVPMLEAADRGRFMVQAEVAAWHDEPIRFERTAPLGTVVRDWLSTITVVATTERNLRRFADTPNSEGRIASYEHLLNTQLEQQRALEAQMRAASPWQPGAVPAERVASLRVTMHEVTLDLEREPAVAAIVDRAFEQGARH